MFRIRAVSLRRIRASVAPFGALLGRSGGSTMSRSSCGRGMTCTLTTSPIRPPAAAPASVAALTAATSPVTNARDQAAADLVPAEELDVGGLQHRVGGFDQGRRSPWSRSCPALPSFFAMTQFSQNYE